MPRAVTAIYRTPDVADRVRDQLERLGLSRHYITIIHVDQVGAASVDADPDGSYGTSDRVSPAVGTPGGAYMGVLPGAGMGLSSGGLAAMPVYRDVDLVHADAFDALHDLHLPEADTRVYQQALRNGDTVVSVEVADDVDLGRIQEIMRRPDEAYDLDDLDTRYVTADYAPRRRTLREDHSEGMLGRRREMQESPRTRDYVRDEPLWPRAGGA